MATMREGFEALEKFDVDVKFVGKAGPGRRYCYWDVQMRRGYWLTRGDIMAAAGIPVLDTYDAVIAKCGHAPVASCFGLEGCFCPHCSSANDAAYTWLANTVISPAVLLKAATTSSVPAKAPDRSRLSPSAALKS